MNKSPFQRFQILNVIYCLVVILMPGTYAQAGELKIGMSTALSGPAQALGQGVKLGVETYFHKVNAAGGIHGNKLKLIAEDDGYEPSRAAPNMRKLISQGVLAVIGNVGTPTAIVTVPIANELKTPFIGVFTGAGVLRKSPPDRYIINYRASYAEETAAMIDGLMSVGIKPAEIAFFTQNDGYGYAGYNGGIKALTAKGYAKAKQLAHGRYTRNTINVEDGLSTILDAATEPKAIIMVGAYKPCAAFIKLAKEELPKVHFLNVSFVGSVALAKELGSSGDGVIITQVVPHFNDNLAAVKEYHAALKLFKASVSPGFVSLEGFLAAKIFVEGLKHAGPKPTRETLVDGLEKVKGFQLGTGVIVNYSKTEHQASHKVWPTIIKAGQFESLNWLDLK